MPEDAMKHIMEYLDFPAILVLRKVCHDLRNFIDDTKPASRLTVIRIHVFPEDILFILKSQTKNEIRIHYEKCSEGCFVEKGHKFEENKRTIMENEDFVTVFFKDFGIILRHQKTVLEEFKTTFHPSNPTVNGTALESLNQSLKSMNHPLQVKTFDVHVNNHKEIMSILPYMDPKLLEWIIIHEIETELDMLNFNKIGLWEQWKQAKNLAVLGFQMANLYQNLKHFSKITFWNREFPTEELILLKEIFLSSPILTEIEIEEPERCAVVRPRLIEAFGEPDVDTDNEIIWFFRIPDTEQFLRITHETYLRVIYLNRIDQSDLPKNVIIQN